MTRRLTIIEEEPKERVDEAKPRNDRHGEHDAQRELGIPSAAQLPVTYVSEISLLSTALELLPTLLFGLLLLGCLQEFGFRHLLVLHLALREHSIQYRQH